MASRYAIRGIFNRRHDDEGRTPTKSILMSEPDEDQCDPGDEHPDDDETDEELRLDIIAWERSRW